MNLQALKTEISKAEYDGMTDQQIADAVNAKTVTSRRLVPNWEFKKHAIENGYWPTIVMFSESGATIPGTEPAQAVPVTLRGLCISVLAWLTDPKIDNTDMDLPATLAMIGGLQQAGIITETHATQLSALANVTTPFVQSLGVSKIGPHHVAEARNA